MAVSFFDTNVLVYLTSSDTAKADRARSLVAAGGVISFQILNEFANVARRKLEFSWAETRAYSATLRSLLAVHPLTSATHDSGLSIAERYRLSTYDAMIAASALEAGCDRLWSEDMHHGLALPGGLQIVNPFRADA